MIHLGNVPVLSQATVPQLQARYRPPVQAVVAAVAAAVAAALAAVAQPWER